MSVRPAVAHAIAVSIAAPPPEVRQATPEEERIIDALREARAKQNEYESAVKVLSQTLCERAAGSARLVTSTGRSCQIVQSHSPERVDTEALLRNFPEYRDLITAFTKPGKSYSYAKVS